MEIAGSGHADYSVRGTAYFGLVEPIMGAHRVALHLLDSSFPIAWDGKICALHSCNNRKCVNSKHIRPGTNADNTRQRDEEGRHRILRGSEHGMAKLTEADIRKIRKDRRTQQAIADDYGITDVNISYIQKRKTWKHVK